MKNTTAKNTTESNQVTSDITRGEGIQALILRGKVAISASPNVIFMIGTIRNVQKASQELLITGEGKIVSMLTT